VKKEIVTRFKLDPAEPPKSDWDSFDTMSEAERHRAALSDPDTLPATETQLARLAVCRTYGPGALKVSEPGFAREPSAICNYRLELDFAMLIYLKNPTRPLLLANPHPNEENRFPLLRPLDALASLWDAIGG
jgi:hypothetical protein